ncbi:MAG: urea carboxylase [Pseudomonadota bacterium]
MLRRVLIANRGAIATRIQRTLRTMGIESVAVFAEADRASSHVGAADRAVCLGEGSALATYLNGDRLIQIARAHEVDAIHPGYGFLSENAAFAQAVEAAGIVFLGPTPRQIECFGLKHEAREIAIEAEVPLLAGSALLGSVEDALVAAEQIGWPVMLKSSAGGGGIGMRPCADAQALRDAYEIVQGQAASSFGDTRVFLERQVTVARHVEVQVFGDGVGQVVVLGDRDCSLQRRNQKVIEEAPAPALPAPVRSAMHAAAQRLMAHVAYRSAGTVEFLYDRDREAVYFLEVNARLQVEHGVTELVTGVDLVEWMLRVGAGEGEFLHPPQVRGAAIQARVYAEDPARGFRPAPGLITGMQLPPSSNGEVRVDGWARAGVTVPAEFDPLLVKILALGEDREAARKRLREHLSATRIDGIQTNLSYLIASLDLDEFVAERHTTASAASVRSAPRSLEVLAPGTASTVQDVKGRLGYWHVGVPPSGAFDTRSLARANALVGNANNASGLECLAEGPILRFSHDGYIALCGARTVATVDGAPVPHDTMVAVRAEQQLRVGAIATDGEGMRTYIAVAGGIDVPTTLGSAATFDLGAFGGHAGRALRAGDVLPLGEAKAPPFPAPPPAAPLGERTTLRVVQGPLLAPDFLTDAYLDTFYATEWTVHYHSSRTGIRLQGPTPEWTRADGGDAGLHPSNVHDNAYAFGAIDFTGDMPIVLGPDGPSLGGFVSPAAIAAADRWKLGQLRPGDRVRFAPIGLAQARTALAEPEAMDHSPALGWRESADEVILARDSERDVVLRAAGDSFLLLEFGAPELDLAERVRVEALSRWLSERADPAVLELTPGVRSLQLRVEPQTDRDQILTLLQDGLDAQGDGASLEVASRIVHLPLAWDDPDTQEDTARYARTVRADAPWCPRNIEFIRRINGLRDEDEVKRIVYDASYLVLGLGDVYLGAPVATPIDPRHRLVTTKYNPARTWTPENAVGIGGAYLCIYGMEGPGGYQFVGRTVQVWNHYRAGIAPFVQPWLLRTFDQLRFFEVTHEELMEMRRDFPLGRLPLRIEDTAFRLAEHGSFLREHSEAIECFRHTQQTAFDAERARWAKQGYDPAESAPPPAASPLNESDMDGTAIASPVMGAVWKVLKAQGDRVDADETVMIVESMKTEIAVSTPVAGVLSELLAEAGTQVDAGQAVALVTQNP